jgi:hypothetical protein
MFDFKIISGIGQTGCQVTKQKLTFLSSNEPQEIFFVFGTSCLKYQNNLLFTKYRTTQNLFNTLNVCLVLLYLVLFNIVLSSTYILQIKRTHVVVWFMAEVAESGEMHRLEK